MKRNYYTSGEFARMAKISVRTIRFYDQKGLLTPSFVAESGTRFYSEGDFVKLQQILLLKYLGFSLSDIKMIIVADQDYRMLRNSLNLQLKLVKDRIEQMQLVEQAIEDTTNAIDTEQDVDWNQMLNLIHLTGMEKSLKGQYKNSSNISARIKLHESYSKNSQGWFSWIYEQCGFRNHSNVLEVGCGNGAMWIENYTRLPADFLVTLNDISEGMLRDTKRELERLEHANSIFQYDLFDCHSIPYKDASFDYVIANHVLFYCEDLPRVLTEIRRVLKKEGLFICSTYGENHMTEITDLVREFNPSISLSANKMQEKFGLENGGEQLLPYFQHVEQRLYLDELIVDEAEPLIEYILSCHGNQNQYIVNRYNEFKSFVEKKTKKGFRISKEAGIFLCRV